MPAVFTNRDMQVLEAVFKLIYEEKDVVKPKVSSYARLYTYVP